jgi:Ca2+-binding RTX toxin-like protein
LSTTLGIVVFFLAYGPITVNVNVSTGGGDTASSGTSLSGTRAAEAAMRSGTEGDDNLTGTIYRDFFDGLGGNDTLTGGDGKDVFQGGPGNDTIYGNNHGDYAFGGANGTDALYGGGGDDVLDAMDSDRDPATPDTINCGAGSGDFAFHNPDDTLIGCENHSTVWFVIQDTP